MTTYRFPKQARISLTGDFERIWKTGRRVRMGSLEARYEPGERPQIGIAINRQTGGAVVRNRLKRWIREHFRTHPQRFQGGWKVILVVRKDLPRAALVRDFERLWSRCGQPTGSPRPSSGSSSGPTS